MSERKVRNNIKIEGGTLIFKNFQGKGSPYNAPGNRNFGVLIDDELADQLIQDGWPVKFLRPRPDDPEEYRQPWLPVKVKYGVMPPIVTLINSRGKMRLNEETIDQLDWSIIVNADLVIRPYNYPEMAGRPAGVSAYLKSLYVTIAEDDFEEKYRDLPDLSSPIDVTDEGFGGE